MGFKGGEVTPLFFIGAALGNTIASLTGAPIDLFAGLGFIAVFAGATNTPIACTLWEWNYLAASMFYIMLSHVLQLIISAGIRVFIQRRDRR